MDARRRVHVRERAENRCEYGQRHQDDAPLAAHHIEPIIPRVHGGNDEPDNHARA